MPDNNAPRVNKSKSGKEYPEQPHQTAMRQIKQNLPPGVSASQFLGLLKSTTELSETTRKARYSEAAQKIQDDPGFIDRVIGGGE